MPERSYTKRELDLKFQRLEEKMQEGSITFQEKNDAWNASILEKLDHLDKDKITPIFEQSKYHNGRLKKLEGWRFSIVGGVAVLTIIVLPAFSYLATQVLHNAEAISAIGAKLDVLSRTVQSLNRSSLPK